MKLALQDGSRYVVRFDKGEDAIAGLVAFMSEQKIEACAFSGIGSCSNVELGYYNPFLKQYRQRPFLEDLEVICLNGTGAMLDGKPAIHAHGMFGRTDFVTVGGHVFKLTVAATCEVVVVKMEGTLQRQNNPDYNLNLFI